jgi:hypothetical protein
VNEKIFVDENETAEGVPGFAGFALHKPHGVKELLAAFNEGDVPAFKKMGRAAEIAAVGAAETAGDMCHFGFKRQGIDSRRLDGCIRVTNGRIRLLTQDFSHETDAFFTADEIAERLQNTIVQNGAIAAKDNLGSGGMFAD